MYRQEGPSIVRATKSHLSQICGLERRIFTNDDRFSKSRLRYLLTSPNAAFFVAFKQGFPIGYGIALKNRLRNGKIKGRVYSVGVLRQFRTHGIGTLLLGTIEKWLINAGASFITLETKATKSGAKDFFKKKGYEVTEFLPSYYTSADGLRMRRYVPLIADVRAGKQQIAARQV